jgi:CheY-like chemotaxis protein
VAHTLLLADDSVTIQRVIELTFADEDVRVVAVSDGDQAVERLKASPPDIVLADIGMPGKNGYEVAQFIRHTPALSHIPVVLLTGAFEPVDQARAAEAGCDSVLAKPFEPQAVISRVKELLARRPGATAAPATPAAPSSMRMDQQPEAAIAPAGQVASVSPEALDDYFDKLDAAFSAFSPSAAPPPDSGAQSQPQGEPIEIDWFRSSPDAGPAAPSVERRDTPGADIAAELGLTYASPEPPAAFEPPTFEPPVFMPPAFDPPVLDAPAAPAGQASVPQPVAEPTAHVAATTATGAHDYEAELAAAFAPTWVEEATAGAHVIPTEAQAAPLVGVAQTPAPPVAVAPPHDPTVAAAPRPEAAPVAVAEPQALPPIAVAAPPPAPKPTALQALPVVAQMPSLTDAFAALLGAEAHEPQASVAWPAAPAPAVSDELIEAIVRRVLDRLTDTVVRETVAETVSRVAEQLVRDEIERIKASIK